MGIESKWLKWVMFCISFVRFSVLINDSPEGLFLSRSGLRLGYALSSFFVYPSNGRTP